jgi:hypothetical protein
MQFHVNIRLYEYWHEQVKIRKKRWNNKEIKKLYWKEICKQKVRKKGACDIAAVSFIGGGTSGENHRVGTFPRFVAIGFYFLSETLI